MQLTKTDFIQFLDCSKSLWLMKRDPDNYPSGEFSAFIQKLLREGYEVERYARQLFAELSDGKTVGFQKIFETENGIFARSDIVVKDADGKLSIYEVKSSTRLKHERGENHIKDISFQLVCAEKSGYQVAAVYIIHLNGDYIRNGEIDVNQLLTVVDVTSQARLMANETNAEINEAISLLAEDDIDRTSCSCLQKSRSHHCDGFKYFNPGVPEYSIYCLPRLSDKKRNELLGINCVALEDIPDNFALSPQQTAVLKAVKSGETQIHDGNICSFINKLSYPLYFFDYETFMSAVPFIDGVYPHQQIPVQYSLHRMDSTKELTHYEYLSMERALPIDLILSMKSHIGPKGSILSWYDTFEKTRNKEMALLYPEHAEFLNDINNRMVNLEDVFKLDYVDGRFKGSTSIKKVLPIVCPHLSYSALTVQDGTAAMEIWASMTQPYCSEATKAETRAQLLEYCKLDTFAMVEIFNKLVN